VATAHSPAHLLSAAVTAREKLEMIKVIKVVHEDGIEPPTDPV
jgi:hypothetical protein